MKTARAASSGREPVRRYFVIALGLLALLFAVFFVDFRQLGPSSAAISFEHSVAGDDLTIDGVTDLPDGTILDWSLLRGDFEQEGGAPILQYGTSVVSGGAFSATVRVPTNLTGLLTMVVKFYPVGGQPAAIANRFGANGEHLRGSGVVDDSGSPVLIVRRAFTLS